MKVPTPQYRCPWDGCSHVQGPGRYQATKAGVTTASVVSMPMTNRLDWME